MDLPNLLTKLKPQQEEARKLVAIEISGSAVKTAVWQVVHHHTEVVTIGPTQTWETEEAADLVEAVQTSLAAALAGIEPKPTEVIFGLPETWVSETSIAHNKKPVIKKICQETVLKPVGFVVTTQAIIHYLRDIEGGPPSGILINIAPDQVVVSLVYLGKLEGAQVVGRSGQIAADVEEGLARFPQKDTIPSRMILYDSQDNLDDLKQELISYDWQSRLPFLHIPKVESLPKDATIKAIAVAGGVEVARSLGLTEHHADSPSPPTTPQTPVEDEPGFPEEADGASEPEEDQQPPITAADEPVTADTSVTGTDEFGFTTIEITADGEEPTQDQAIAHQKATETTSARPIETVEPTPKASTDTHTSGQAPEPELVPVDEHQLKPSGDQEKQAKPPRQNPLSGFVSSLKKIRPSIPRLRLPIVNKIKFPPLLIIGLILLLLISLGGVAAYWYLPKASVAVYVELMSIPKEVTFNLDPDATEPNLNNQTLPAQVETVEVSGEEQTPTTGSKTVGERATGTVAIYNRTTSSKTFDSGTQLTANNLTFTLDDDVTIASASTTENPDFSVTIQPTKTEAAITAEAIGSQYNLGVDSQFTLANFSTESFVARAVTDLSGGSSREVQVVSSADSSRLRQELLDKLQEQASQELTQQTGNKQGVVFLQDYTVLDETQSHEVGAEADSVSLNLSVSQTAYTYNIKDISLLTQQQMLDNLPDGYLLQAEETNVEVLETNVNEDGSVNLTANTTLMLMPIIDQQAIAQNIAGKYPLATEDYFKTLPGFVRTETTITPPLPARINTFPRQPQNITVEIKAAKNR